MSEIVERLLRWRDRHYARPCTEHEILTLAADEITRLRAENERLVEAIEELEETVREMLRAIQRGRLASIGAIHNTYVAQISVGRVEKWSNALTDQEEGAND